MKKGLRGLAAFCAVALALFFFTPLGPSALARLLERAADDWHVDIGEQSGAFLFGFSLADIQCQNEALGLDMHIGSLVFKPWSWAVDIQTPNIRIEPVVERTPVAAEAPGDIELPIALLPDLDVKSGQLHWAIGESPLIARGWQASYRAVDDTSGLLVVALPALHGLASLRSLKLDLMLSAHRVDIGVIEAVGGSDSSAYEARASFSLGLALPRSVQLSVEAAVAGLADSLQGTLDLTVAGSIEPLQLVGQLSGAGRLPTVADVTLQGTLHSNGDRIDFDDLQVALLDGELMGQASYFFAGDSLQAALRGEGFDLAGIAGREGRAHFDFAAEASLQSKRYAADLTAGLRDFELLPGERFDVELKAGHQFDGQTRLTLDSRVLALAATGDSDWQGGYDLAVEGTLLPSAFLSGAAPVQIAGRARPDTLALQLASARLPGDMSAGFGPLSAELNLFAHSYLDAVVRLERDLLVARAAVDFAANRVDTLVVALRDLDLGRVVPGVSGQVDMDISGRGGLAFEQLQLRGTATATPLRFSDWQSAGLAADFSWDRGMAEGVLRGPELLVQMGLHGAGQLEVQTEFTGPLLTGPEGGEVALVGALQYAGPLNEMRAADGRLVLEKLFLRQGAFALQEQGPLAVDYRAGRFNLTAVHLQTPAGLLQVAGWAGFDSLALAATWPNLQLDGLLPDLSAMGAGHLQLGGPWTAPVGQGEIRLADVRLDTMSLGGVSLRLGLADTLVAEVEAEAGLNLTFSCPVEPLLHQGIGRARLGIDAVAADLGPVLSYVLDHPLRGQLDLSGALEIALGDSALHWDGLSGHIDVGAMAIETEVDADSLRLDLLTDSRFALAEGRVALDSLVVAMQRYDRDRQALRPAGTLRLGGELAVGAPSRIGLDLQEVELFFFGGPEGVADIVAQMSGTADAPELLADLEVVTEDFGDLRGRLAGDGFGGDLHLNWTTLIEDSLVVTGHMPWDLATGEFDFAASWLEAQSQGIGLFVFADLIADLDYLDGRIGADLRVEGLDSTLAISGSVGVEELQVALLDIEPVYALPDGQLRFDGRAIDLVGFSAAGDLGRGYESMDLSGQVDLARLDEPHFDLQLYIRRLACYYEDIFQADDIALDLSFAGALTGSELSGSIRLNQPRSEPTLVVFNAPPVPPPPPALRDEFLENMALAVELDLRGLSLDSELAEVEASGAIGVGGTFYKPIFQGDVGIENGRMFVLNQQFEFEEGRVVFNSLEPTGSILDVAYDPLELDPELDLRATTSVEDVPNDERYQVTLLLQGRAKEVAPQFSSEPTEEFTSIVNLLAFGSTTSQDYTAALGQVAGQLLSSRVEKTGLDEFALLPSSTVVGANSGSALRVGKYFSGLPLPLWVRYEALLGEMSSGEVRIEHKLKSFLTVTGSAQSEYDRYGLGIGVKKKF